MKTRGSIVAWVVGAAVAGGVGFEAAAQVPLQGPGTQKPSSVKPNPSRPGAQAPGFDRLVRARLELLNAKVREAKGVLPKEHGAEVARLHELYLAYGQFGDGELLRDLNAARRLAQHMATPKLEDAPGHVLFALDNPQTASAVALGVRGEDSVTGVYDALRKLRAARPDVVADKSGAEALTAAICLVHDKPRAHPVLGKAIEPDPVGYFDFYWTNRDRMLFPVTTMPVDLLEYVVDAHAPLEEMRWALKSYAKNTTTGKLYGAIVYDTAAFKYGKSRKVLDAPGGYTLQNIRKLGGVCTEQAYFASEVAKSIGVPACMVTGEGSDVGHAWVGYLRTSSGRYWWDFSEGRYDEYQDTQGEITDPQTQGHTSDAFVSMSAMLASTPRAARRVSGALTEGALRLGGMGEGKNTPPFPPRWPTEEERKTGGWEGWGEAPQLPARGCDAHDQLVMLREALRQCPANEAAWQAVVQMAEKGKLTTAQKSEWAEAAIRMAGRNQPEFALWAVTPMIRTVEPIAEQDRMWGWAFGEFRQRPDLASRVRFEQGMAWEKAGNNAKAFSAYQDVIQKFADDGRAVLEALSRCEDLLVGANRADQTLGLYKEAFNRVKKPGNMSPQFASMSNYYLVGFRYAQILELSGKESESRRVKKMIGVREEEKDK